MSEGKFCFFARPTEYKQIRIVKPFHRTSAGKNNILTNHSFGWGKVKRLQNLSCSLPQSPAWKRTARSFLSTFYIKSELFTAL